MRALGEKINIFHFAVVAENHDIGGPIAVHVRKENFITILFPSRWLRARKVCNGVGIKKLYGVAIEPVVHRSWLVEP